VCQIKSDDLMCDSRKHDGPGSGWRDHFAGIPFYPEQALWNGADLFRICHMQLANDSRRCHRTDYCCQLAPDDKQEAYAAEAVGRFTEDV
jgi:hypothetical protein